MLNEGFIFLHRSLLQWGWYQDANCVRVFIHLLLTVNYKPQHWRGLKVRRGQRVASVGKLAQELGITPKSVRVALEHLQAAGAVSCRAIAGGTLFTVEHYGRYQGWWGKVSQGEETAAQSHFPAPAQAEKGKQRASEGQQWKKEQNTPFACPDGAGLQAMSLEELFCAAGAAGAHLPQKRRARPAAQETGGAASKAGTSMKTNVTGEAGAPRAERRPGKATAPGETGAPGQTGAPGGEKAGQ